MFKKSQSKSGLSLDAVINKRKNLMPEHRERSWVIQWVYFSVLFLFILMIHTIVDYYN
ncbi:hypothetical protein PQO03_02200 [Lentisphaera profundi]|uniref:Uncharacterized protein n=1 Tax=Lentisphaera profundi TaxID=1658616 RepID=A0ABY7VRF4_9BACT|nr:hypothetical protein [Lentisphaera profundi]WDE96771.1 hypothetical protein PQO03_02200 [Lentisphaera profundi]